MTLTGSGWTECAGTPPESPGAAVVRVSTRRIPALIAVSTTDTVRGGMRPIENEDSRTRTVTSPRAGAAGNAHAATIATNTMGFV